MSAYEVTDKVIEQIKADTYDLIILNFANCDMVGHRRYGSQRLKRLKRLTNAWAG